MKDLRTRMNILHLAMVFALAGCGSNAPAGDASGREAQGQGNSGAAAPQAPLSGKAAMAGGDATTQQAPSSGGPDAWTKVSFPPIPQGTYTYAGNDCAKAAAQGNPEAWDWPFMRLTPTLWQEIDGSNKIVAVEQKGQTRYRFALQFEDEVGRKTTEYTEIEILGPDTFKNTAKDGPTYKHCKVDYFKRLNAN